MLKRVKKFIKFCLPYGIVMMINNYRNKTDIVQHEKFSGSEKYWEGRYATGGKSGGGSYGRLAAFKADMINDFCKKYNIQSVIEFGCGDGNQLSLGKYKQYIGFDVSETAIQLCQDRFKGDASKKFVMLDKYNNEKADLVLSLDVIYHLIEDDIFKKHIACLFHASTKFVIVYAWNFDEEQTEHVRPRKFTAYIDEHIKGYELFKYVTNKYPYDKNDPDNTSLSDFYIYLKNAD
jgi:SAM-dependent methyltransferase